MVCFAVSMIIGEHKSIVFQVICKIILVFELFCYSSLCNKLITIVNYYLETGLSYIVY